MNKKIRDAELQKIPFMLVVGDKEAETGTVAVREKGKQGSQTLSIDEFVSKIKEIISNKHAL